MQPKSIFKSRSALLALLAVLAGSLGTACEPVGEWIKGNGNVILIILGALGFWLRRITDGRVTIFPEGDPAEPGAVWREYGGAAAGDGVTFYDYQRRALENSDALERYRAIPLPKPPPDLDAMSDARPDQ